MLTLSLTGCIAPDTQPTQAVVVDGKLVPPTPIAGVPAPTPLPTRPPYAPGELVDYIAQTGDTLPALAAHFNTTEGEIRAANLNIPNDATTMPPGMPMKIPIYFEALWGSPYQIIPDSLFIDGPAQVGFDSVAFVKSQPGWFKNYHQYAGGQERYGGELIDNIAVNFSVSPRLLLAILEYQTGALSQAAPPDPAPDYPLGYVYVMDKGYYNQLLWAANTLNNGYYSWRVGLLKQFEHPDGRIERPDPWQNAATVALQYYFNIVLPDKNTYTQATHAQGLQATYARLFGDPWADVKPHIPVSLVQPSLRFPFNPGRTWAFTGGPHTSWGDGEPYTSLDFAPPTSLGGCVPSGEWAVAVADGVIARTAPSTAELDLDGDNDIRTGWVIYYLHLQNDSMIRQGVRVKAGDPLGHPSCEGGHATGTHVHIARKYNGEWIPAGGPLAFDLEGWVAQNGSQPYEGSLTRYSQTITASVGADSISHIQSQGADIP
jgi:LasA protease